MTLRLLGFALFVVLLFGAAPLYLELQQWRRAG